MRIASWNKRAKYYVITEPGKKGIQSRTDVGEPPPTDCELKNCTGEEWQEFIDDVETQRQIFESRGNAEDPEKEITVTHEISKKKDFSQESDTSLKQKQSNGNELAKKENWFDSIFGG